MERAALIVATLGGLTLIAVAVKGYLVLAQAHQAVKRLSRLMDEEVSPALRAWAEAARGVERAAGKLEEAVGPLRRNLTLIERLTERIEAHVLTAAAIQPAIARVSAWLGGVRKGLGEGREARPKGRGAGEGAENEVG